MPLKQVAPRRRATWRASTQHQNCCSLHCLPASIFLPGTRLGLCGGCVGVLLSNPRTSWRNTISVSLTRFTVQRGEGPPRQHVAGHGQTVRGNQGWSLAAVKAARAGCRRESLSVRCQAHPAPFLLPPACSSG